MNHQHIHSESAQPLQKAHMTNIWKHDENSLAIGLHQLNPIAACIANQDPPIGLNQSEHSPSDETTLQLLVQVWLC